MKRLVILLPPVYMFVGLFLWWAGVDNMVLGPVVVQEVQQMTTTVKPGGKFHVRHVGERFRACPSRWTFNAVTENGAEFKMESRDAVSIIPRKFNIVSTHRMPTHVPPGQTHIKVVAIHKCNPMISKVETFNSLIITLKEAKK